jgi:hypothetical protein
MPHTERCTGACRKRLPSSGCPSHPPTRASHDGRRSVIRSDNGPEMTAKVARSWRAWAPNSLYRVRQPLGERLLRKLQRQAAGRAARWRNLLQFQGNQDPHRAVVPPLQHGQTPLIAGISATRAANFCASANPSGYSASYAVISVTLVQNIRQASRYFPTRRAFSIRLISKNSN